MKIITIVGARPQFIKAAAVSRAIKEYNHDNNGKINELIVHTGQHYDVNMSDIFFEEMDIPKPDYNLEINGLSHGAMTGRMLEEIEKVLLIEKPDAVLVYGDTNSTLAGALAAAKLHIPVAHVEAGLRSFNMKMPEEINRILTDRVSTWLFCPTETAVQNLRDEGFFNLKNEPGPLNNDQTRIINAGDVMLDAAIFYESRSRKPDIDLPAGYILATIHRAENTDSAGNIEKIVSIFNRVAETEPVIIPLHPRTKGIITKNGLEFSSRVHVIDPVGYLEMVYLISNSSMIMTDSGGLQKEAYFFKKPCLTLRTETEWVELVENHVNTVTGLDLEKILEAYSLYKTCKPDFSMNLYGNGKSSRLIIQNLLL